MKEQTFHVEGMSCNHCKATVTKAVQELSGVASVEVSLEEKRVTVSFDPNRTSEEQIKEAIVEAGYEVVAGAR